MVTAASSTPALLTSSEEGLGADARMGPHGQRQLRPCHTRGLRGLAGLRGEALS